MAAEYLPIYMFFGLALLLFSGFPVAFVLGGVALTFGLLGWTVDHFAIIEFYNILPRMWGNTAENPVLVAVPCFVFMGTMLERSGVAEDLLNCLQVLLRRVPGALALSLTVMGTIMAATTGIVGASVIMMSLIGLPMMMNRGYAKWLATGTICASAVLGILIPPSIMLVIMADLLAVSVGNLFVSAVFPGLLLSLLYCLYIYVCCTINTEFGPPLPDDVGPSSRAELWRIVVKGFVPPVFLIFMVLGSIFAGWATPTEAAGVGSFGSILLAIMNRRCTFEIMKDVLERTALTCGMIFFIFMGATAFSYVFRSLGGDDIIIHWIEASGLGSWGLLFLLMYVVFQLGFFFDWVEITLIVLPVFAPILTTMDFGDHIPKTEIIYWFAILLAINLQNSFLTPPFGFALFYMKGVAPPEIKMQDIYRGIIPFVGLQVTGLGLTIAFPGIAMWAPRYFLGD